MKLIKNKIFIILVVISFFLFFSNDFGLIDIEKTAIITAIAIDKENDEYICTAQVAVPEASSTTSENERAQVKGKGGTVGAAIKSIGDTSGWYPNLYFCNLIIVGDSLVDENLITVLDYFSKTLRVQDSALVVMSEKKASDILAMSTPLDNISSFALQKIILKNPGFDSDVIETDIKSFCIDYYSITESSFMPLIKTVSLKDENENKDEKSGSAKAQSESGSSGGENSSDLGGAKGTTLFNANATALFYKGTKVGELTPDETLVYNAINEDFKGTTIEVVGVDTKDGKSNFLLTVLKNKSKIKLKESDGKLLLDISLSLYCKVSDTNLTDSPLAYAENAPIPQNATVKLEKIFTDIIHGLIEKEKETKCDFLKIKKELYRFNHKYYETYKDDYLNRLVPTVKVDVYGQK